MPALGLLQRDPDDRIRVLDENGAVLSEATVPDLSEDELVSIYPDLEPTRIKDGITEAAEF